MSQTPTTGGNLYRAVYAGVAVVECHILGTVVMRRCEDCFINATQILKAADLDKPRRTRILERQIHPYEHEKVQGGYGRYQGTWIPLPGAVVLAREHGVYADLQQLLELTPEQLARLPTVPRQRAVSGNSGGGVASPRSTNQAAAKRKNTAAPILPARRAAPGSSALGKSTGGGTRGGGGYSSAGVPSGSLANTGYVGNGNNTESLEYTPQPKRVRVGYTPTTTAAVSAYSTSSTGPKPLGPPGANVLPTPNSISTQSSHSVLTPTAPRGTGLMAAGTPHSPIWPLASPLGKPPPGALLRMPGLTRHPDSRRGSTSHRSAMDMGDGNHGEDQPGDETETDGSEYEDRTDAERRPLVGGATRPGSSPSLAPIYKYQPELGHRPLALFAQPSVSMASRSKPLPDCRMDDPIDTHLNTTLHWAAAYGRLEMIEVLIKHGADLGLLNQNHQWALVTAVVGVTMGPSRLPDSECPDSVELLNRTVTHSSRYGVGAFPRILALLHPTLMCVSPSGWSVFHYLVDATRHRQLSPVLAHYYLQSLLNYFIEHRLNPDIIAHRNHEGHTALDMTLQTQGHPSLQGTQGFTTMTTPLFTPPRPRHPHQRRTSLQVIRESPGKPFAYDRHAPAATALSPLGPKPMGGPHRVFTAPQPLMGLGSISTQAAGQSSTTGTGSPPTMGRKPHVERPSASSEVASAQMNCTSSSPAHATDSYNRGPPVPTPDSARDQAARLRLPLRRRSFLGLASVTHRPPVPSSPAVPSTEPTPSRVATANTVIDESTGGPPLRSQAPVDLAPMDHCAQPSDRYDRAIGTLTDHVSDVVRTRRIDHLDTLKEYWQQQRLLAQTLAIVKAETQRIRQETQALKAGLDEPYQVRGRSDGSQPGPNSVSSETKPGSQLVISTKVEAQAEAQALQEVARAALSQRLQECVCRYQGQLERHASSQPDRDRTPPLSTAPMTPKVCSLGRQDSALANTETKEASTPPSQHTHTVFTSPFLPSRRSSMSSVLRSPSQAVSPPDSPSDIRPLGWNAQDQSAKPAPPNQAKSGDTVSPAMAATDADLVEFLKRECTTRQADLIQLVPTLLSTLLEKDCLDLPAVGYCLDRMDDALQTAVQKFANSLASHDKAQQLSTSTSPGLPPSSSTATATATTAKLTFSSPAPSSPISEGQSTPTGRGHGEAAAPTTLYNPQHGLAPLPPPSPISLLPGSTGAIRSSTDLDSASPEPTTGIPPLVLPSVVVGPRDRMAMYQQILAKGIGMPYHRIESSLPDILKSLEKKVRQQQRIRQQPPMAISSK
ncbi:Transcription factor mbp1 [Dimargaris cristalligena]|nr:Transcription factor mbp1 [Dimargaris cristalligena]